MVTAFHTIDTAMITSPEGGRPVECAELENGILELTNADGVYTVWIVPDQIAPLCEWLMSKMKG